MNSKRVSAFLDLLSASFAWGCAGVVTLCTTLLLWQILKQGIGDLSWFSQPLFELNFGELATEIANKFQQVFQFVVEAPADSGRSGGIGPIILSTFLIVLVCMVVSVPLGLGTSILLAEYTSSQSRVSRFIRRSLDTLAGVPSIVFGLFGNAFFCIALGMGNSILAGGLTLACMVLPILIRITEQGIRSVPNEHRRGAAALGLSKTTTLFRIILPSAAPALIAGWVLGVGRALAETAALIFTSGYSTRTPESLMDSGRSLSVHIYDMAMNVVGGNERASSSALTLVLMVLAINLMASVVTRFAVGRSRGQVLTSF